VVKRIEIPKIGACPTRRTNVFISPVNLTANGRAHLGHAGGPFLRMDVLARHLRRSGHRVTSGLTTDGFENHVVVKATAERCAPSELAHRYYRQIRDDLSSIGIRFDRFDDPGDASNIGHFNKVKDELVRSLELGGQVVVREEQLPVDDALAHDAAMEDRFCIGGWFAARCPRCEAPAGSFFCEACGHHFEPGEAKEPLSRRGKIVAWIPNKSVYLRVSGQASLSNLWAGMGIEVPFAATAQRYVDFKGQTMRLTVPGRYGLDWPSHGLAANQICFSYSSLLYAHHLYCGDRVADMKGLTNPFLADDDTFLISATGIDNTIPMLVGVSGCAVAQPSFRPFDRIYFNHFLRLDGSKFSTSRGHVIWTGDIARLGGLNVDLLRFYLAEICPEEGETDLRASDLVARHNALLELMQPKIEASAATLIKAQGSQVTFDEPLLRILQQLYEDQVAALSIDLLRVSRASLPIADWLAAPGAFTSANVAYTWLKGLAFLGAPLMPDLSHALWRWLGHIGIPSAEAFFHRPAIMHGLPPRLHGRRLFNSDLDPCLPRGRAA
jgi:methionyl-tRNA synthetase